MSIYTAITTIYNSIHDRTLYITKNGVILFVIVTLIAIPSFWTSFGGGIEEPGRLFEKHEYEGSFIVEMSRKPETDKDRKVYTLPATIYRSKDVVCTKTRHLYSRETETEEVDVEKLNYHISKLHFKNGGYLYFDKDYPEKSILTLNTEEMVTDYKGDEYYIVLTSKKPQ